MGLFSKNRKNDLIEEKPALEEEREQPPSDGADEECPAPEPEAGHGEPPPARFRDLAELLAQRAVERNETLYALVDAARDVKVLSVVHQHQCPKESLFKGTELEPLADVSPYLVEPLPRSNMMEQLLEFGWGNGALMFVFSREGYTGLFEHLKQLVTVRDDEGREWLFRFYDPRVVTDYLHTATAEETTRFFRGLDALGVEIDGGERILFIVPADGNLTGEALPVFETGAEKPEPLPEPEPWQIAPVVVAEPTNESVGEEDEGQPGNEAIETIPVLRATQFDAMEDRIRQREIEALVVHARAAFPGETQKMDDAALREEVAGIHADAAGYELYRLEEIRCFMDLAFLFGREFHKAEWAEPILEDPYLADDDKLALLQRYTERKHAPSPVSSA